MTRSATGPARGSGRAPSVRRQYTSGSVHSLQLDVEPFELLTVVDAGDANIVPAWIERAHAMIYRKVREVAATGAIPIVLGGDHSITWPSATAVAEVRRPGSIGIVHFDAHADTANDDWGVLAGHGTPMRRLIESGAVAGRNFVQVGLRGYWPPVETFEWMRAHGMRYHFMTEIEERGAEAVIDDAIAEALDGPDSIYLSVDIDVIDPGPGAGDRHAGARRDADPGGSPGRSARSSARVELAGMDIVEVSPPYDHAETTAMVANRAALEAISALARQARRPAVRSDVRPSRRPRPPIGTSPRSPRCRPTEARRRSPACTTSISSRIQATSICISRSRDEPAGRSSSSASGPAAWRSPSPRRVTT